MPNNSERKLRGLRELQTAWLSLGPIGALDFLIERASRNPAPRLTARPQYRCVDVPVDGDLSKYSKLPSQFPAGLKLPPLQGLGNDYSHLLKNLDCLDSWPRVSVVVLTYNRDPFLRRTLIALCNQNYPAELIEVLVTDDGGNSSAQEIVRDFQSRLDIKYCWHADSGFTPAAARNNAVKMARNDFIIQLDVDMYPDPGLVKSYARYAPVINRLVLIGPRKYVDLNEVVDAQLEKDPLFIRQVPEVRTNNEVAGREESGVSVDWRLETFKSTDYLRKEKLPFRMFAAGNVAFSRSAMLGVGGYDERFRDWGHEDGELGFRLYNCGYYFVPVMSALAYHQEPAGGKNETDRAEGKSKTGLLYAQLCPYYRRLTSRKPPYEVPTVSIYIPAYNAKRTICDAIESALGQTFRDLEVVVCNDGSTDGTGQLLEEIYGDNPRVRILHQINGGIGVASNSAVRACKGIFVGQLDSDDYLAEDVVEKCVEVLRSNNDIGLVYTTYENEYPDGSVKPGYNYPVFTREKLLTGMIVHHFRMFRRRDWARTEGFSERLSNAVDYDMYLKLAEVCKARHLNIVGYRRRLHGGNTSLKNFNAQNENARKAVANSFQRLGLPVKVELEHPSSPKIVLSLDSRGSTSSPGMSRSTKSGGSRSGDGTFELTKGLPDPARVESNAKKANDAARDGDWKAFERHLQTALDHAYERYSSSNFPQVIAALGEHDATGSGPAAPIMKNGEVRTAVFCSGFGWSGSSAVFDFLRQYHPAPVYCFSRSEVKVFWRRGRGFGLPDILEAIEREEPDIDQRIRDLVFGSILGLNHGLVKSGNTRKLLNESLVNRLVTHRPIEDFDTLVAELVCNLQQAARLESARRRARLKESASLFLQRLMAHQCSDKATHCAFDNGILAGDVDVARWFDQARVIAVSRDPRDAYVSRKLDGKWNRSVQAFCKDHKLKVRKFEKASMKLEREGALMRVGFEEFVSSKSVRFDLLSSLGVPLRPSMDEEVFSPEKSSKNVGIYKTYKSQGEIAEIEAGLSGESKRLTT